jgi:hypothetical protein
MKTIPLGNRTAVALVDDEDFEYLSQFHWWGKDQVLKYGGTTTYAHRKLPASEGGTNRSMHDEIMRLPKGLMVDHKDRDGLNNQKTNLRSSTRSQNGYNCVAKKEGKKGTWYYKKTKSWRTLITYEKNRLILGHYTSEDMAAEAYDCAAVILHEEFARLNFPDRNYDDALAAASAWTDDPVTRLKGRNGSRTPAAIKFAGCGDLLPSDERIRIALMAAEFKYDHNRGTK